MPFGICCGASAAINAAAGLAWFPPWSVSTASSPLHAQPLGLRVNRWPPPDAAATRLSAGPCRLIATAKNGLHLIPEPYTRFACLLPDCSFEQPWVPSSAAAAVSTDATCAPGKCGRRTAVPTLGRLAARHLQGAGTRCQVAWAGTTASSSRADRRPQRVPGPALPVAGGTLGFLRSAPCEVKPREWDQPPWSRALGSTCGPRPPPWLLGRQTHAPAAASRAPPRRRQRGGPRCGPSPPPAPAAAAAAPGPAGSPWAGAPAPPPLRPRPHRLPDGTRHSSCTLRTCWPGEEISADVTSARPPLLRSNTEGAAAVDLSYAGSRTPPALPQRMCKRVDVPANCSHPQRWQGLKRFTVLPSQPPRYAVIQ